MGGAQGFQGSENNPYDIVTVGTYQYHIGYGNLLGN